MADMPDSALLDTAMAWHLRLDSADAEDWEEFTRWLEADARHNAAYEWVVADEAQWTPLLDHVQFPADPPPAPVNEVDDLPAAAGVRWRWAGAAAAIVAVALVGLQIDRSDPTYAVETRPGQTRTVDLTGGSRVELNGGTRVVLDRSDPRHAVLARGEARFSIVHDAAHPFVLEVGDRRLIDLGTRFNVVRSDDLLRVGVSQGSIRFAGGGHPVELRAGDVLTEQDGRVGLSRRPAAAIGSWTQGALMYEGAPLTEVAADLSRSLGVRIQLSPELAGTRFSGVIQTSGGARQVKTALPPLLGVTLEDRGDTWLLHR